MFFAKFLNPIGQTRSSNDNVPSDTIVKDNSFSEEPMRTFDQEKEHLKTLTDTHDKIFKQFFRLDWIHLEDEIPEQFFRHDRMPLEELSLKNIVEKYIRTYCEKPSQDC